MYQIITGENTMVEEKYVLNIVNRLKAGLKLELKKEL